MVMAVTMVMIIMWSSVLLLVTHMVSTHMVSPAVVTSAMVSPAVVSPAVVTGTMVTSAMVTNTMVTSAMVTHMVARPRSRLRGIVVISRRMVIRVVMIVRSTADHSSALGLHVVVVTEGDFLALVACQFDGAAYVARHCSLVTSFPEK